MENPLNLLKEAVHEERQQKRISLAIKAVKVITDILPFDDISEQLIREESLVKYLFVAYPILPSPIEMTAKCLFERFKEEKLFLKEFWSACEFISTLPEKNPSKGISLTNLEHVEKGIKEIVKSKLAERQERASHLTDNYSGEFCQEINENTLAIKYLTVLLLDDLMQYMYKELSSVYDYYRSSLGKLLLEYIQHSGSDVVIVKIVGMLEKLKEYQKKFDAKKRNYDDELQMLLLEKRHLLEDQKTARRPRHRKKPGQSTVTGLGSGAANISARQTRTNLEIPTLQHIEASLNTEEGELNTDSDRTIDDDSREKLIANFELFLCQRDIPLLGKNDYMIGVLKNPDKLATFFTLLTEPDGIPLDDMWKNTFSDVEKIDLTTTKAQLVLDDTGFSQARKNRYKSHLRTVGYQIRSYKVMQTLIDPRNVKLLINVNRYFLQSFFGTLYNALTKDELACNMNHIVSVMLYFLSIEQDICINHILHNNFLFRFLHMTDFALIQQFYISLLAWDDHIKLSPENIEKIFKYCQYTYFFTDMAKALLYGENTVEDNKQDATYNPSSVKSLIDLDGDADPDNVSYKDMKPHNCQQLLEEQPGVTADIDRLKESKALAHRPKKSTKRAKFRDSAANTPTARRRNLPSPKKAKKYPSLVEKWDILYPGTPNWDFAADSIASTKNKGNEQAPKRRVPMQSNPNRNTSELKSGLSVIENPATMKKSVRMESDLQQSSLLSVPKDEKSITGVRAESRGQNVRPDSQMSLTQKKIMWNDTSMSSGMTNLISEQAQKGGQKLSRVHKELRILTKQGTQDSLSSLGGGGYKPVTPYTIDTSMEANAMTQLSKLYPTDTRAFFENAMDKESKKEEFSVKEILENDAFSLALCEIIHASVKKAVEMKESKFREVLQQPPIDSSDFWEAMFGNDHSLAFEYLYKNYLYKIKVYNLTISCSGFEAGQIVNLILDQISINPYLKAYKKDIHSLTVENFIFLQKVIIQSHTWVKKKDIRVNLQGFEVKNQLGAARLSLLQTFFLVIRNDRVRGFLVFDEILDTMWDLLINWTFEFRTNNMMLNIINGIFDLTMTYADRKILFCVLIKLNLLTKMLKMINEIKKNEVEEKELNGGPIISAIRRIVILIARVFTEREDLGDLPRQLMSSQSWKDLRSKLIPSEIILMEDQPQASNILKQKVLAQDIEPIRPRTNHGVLGFIDKRSEDSQETFRGLHRNQLHTQSSQRVNTTASIGRRHPDGSTLLSNKPVEQKESVLQTSTSFRSFQSPTSMLSSKRITSPHNMLTEPSQKSFIIKSKTYRA